MAELEFLVCIATRSWNIAVAYLDVGIQAGTRANAGE